jgi:protocatechuate 3,4-dioxygenase beta subunit
MVMRPLLSGLLALLLIAAAARAQAPPAGATSLISGRVFNASDGAPLRRARVIITSAGRGSDPVFTGDDGRFIADAPRRPFTVTVTKAGYIPVVMTPSAAQLAGPLTFGLTRSVAVGGRVVDSSGAPPTSGDAYVTARLLSAAAGGGTGAPTRFYAETDQLGVYRLGGLAAGRYEITAIRIPFLQKVNATGPVDEQLFGSRDSLDVARAVTVSIDPGDELHDLDFMIPAGPTRSCATASGVTAGSQTTTGRIRGRVTGPTGEPLVCAQLHAASAAGPNDVVPYVHTDAEGRYTLDGLPAGSFVVRAFMSGYLPLRYGQRVPSDDARAVVLREGERRDGVDITLPREALITGTLWDEHGEPVEGVSVSAFQLRRLNGRMVAASRVIARATDDRGQYRLVAVPPGSYLIGASAPGAVSTTAEARGYVSSYYPGTTELPLARPVVVDAGTAMSGIDIVLSSVRTATVSGSVLDPAGRPFAGTVSLTTSARSGVTALGPRSAQTDAAGRFALRGVPPGDYVLKAPVQGGGSPLFGMQYVTVTDRDPAPATLRLTEGATLEGRITLDVAPGTNPAGLELTYAATDFDRDPTVHRSSFMREFGTGGVWDGTFRMTGVFGPSRLTLPRLPGCDTCYLKSARVNGTDAAETPFDFGLNGGIYRDVEVVISDAGATIEGRVADEAAARESVAMLVIPLSDTLRYPGSRYVKVGSRLRDGRFEAAGLPPGEYIVAATNSDDRAIAMDPDDPDLGALLAARGTRVTVFERERASVNLRLLRR